jgi:glycosyltransferase involved in cell wall biosynthesis
VGYSAHGPPEVTELFGVLHVTPSVETASFGLGEVVLNLTREQNNQGCEARIWCMSPVEEIDRISASCKLSRDWLRSFPPIGPPRVAFSPSMIRATASLRASQGHVVHQHGIWTACSLVTNLLHQQHGLPHIVAPQGSLDAWALRRSHWRKRIASIAYQDANLRSAACLHAVADAEAAGFQAYGLRNPIAIIPNGISNAWLDSVGSSTRFRQQFGIPADARVMLFLSRITPKKGLPMLIEVMSTLEAGLCDWWLVIAGADEFGHEAEIRRLVGRLQLVDRVRFVGPVFGQAKRDAFAAADLFVLPTHSEGAPIVVLEALGAGIPVLTTKGTPWPDLVDYRCGWWTDISVVAIRKALEDAVHLERQELAEMGARGKALVSAKYTWSQVGQMTIALYKWLLKRGSRPQFVFLD